VLDDWADTAARRDALWASLEHFTPVVSEPTGDIESELARPERNEFDDAVLGAAGAVDAEEARLTIERDLRALVARKSRARSVASAQADRTPGRRVRAAADAFASRIAAQLEPHPDPRDFVPESSVLPQLVAVRLPIDGTLTIGEDLFTHGVVFAGSEPVAEPGEPKAAQFIRGALLHDPTQDVVEVPSEPFLTETLEEWRTATDEWFAIFESTA
jgi:hypothetical protein